MAGSLPAYQPDDFFSSFFSPFFGGFVGWGVGRRLSFCRPGSGATRSAGWGASRDDRRHGPADRRSPAPPSVAEEGGRSSGPAARMGGARGRGRGPKAAERPSRGAVGWGRASRGASAGEPPADAERARGELRPGSAETRRAASEGDTGAPLFSRITGTLASKRGGAGGGARRVTTARDATAGGRGAAASRVVMCNEARVGTTGTGPRSTGADSIVRMTVAVVDDPGRDQVRRRTRSDSRPSRTCGSRRSTCVTTGRRGTPPGVVGIARREREPSDVAAGAADERDERGRVRDDANGGRDGNPVPAAAPEAPSGRSDTAPSPTAPSRPRSIPTGPARSSGPSRYGAQPRATPTGRPDPAVLRDLLPASVLRRGPRRPRSSGSRSVGATRGRGSLICASPTQASQPSGPRERRRSRSAARRCPSIDRAPARRRAATWLAARRRHGVGRGAPHDASLPSVRRRPRGTRPGRSNVSAALGVSTSKTSSSESRRTEKEAVPSASENCATSSVRFRACRSVRAASRARLPPWIWSSTRPSSPVQTRSPSVIGTLTSACSHVSGSSPRANEHVSREEGDARDGLGEGPDRIGRGARGRGGGMLARAGERAARPEAAEPSSHRRAHPRRAPEREPESMNAW